MHFIFVSKYAHCADGTCSDRAERKNLWIVGRRMRVFLLARGAAAVVLYFGPDV